MSAEGIDRGHDGVRRVAEVLHRYIGPGDWRCDNMLAEGEVALVQWSGTTNRLAIHDGADTFVVREGRIVTQTIHYSSRPLVPAEPTVTAWRQRSRAAFDST